MTHIEHTQYIISLYEFLLKNSGMATRKMATDRMEDKFGIIVSRRTFVRYLAEVGIAFNVTIDYNQKSMTYSVKKKF